MKDEGATAHDTASRTRVSSGTKDGLTHRPPLLLLAEDDTELRWAIAQLLQQWGWEVHEVANGAELLDTVSASVLEGRARIPDLIVTDIRMPGASGLSIVEGLRGLGCLTPVIVMSAFGDPDIRVRVQTLHGAAYLDKPIDLDALEAALRSVTRSKNK